MRFKLEFQIKNNTIPLDYRRGIVSYFKRCLINYNEEIFNLVYGVGAKKDITFAPIFSIKNFSKENIELHNGNLKVFYSIEDTLLGIHIYNSLSKYINKEAPFFSKNTITLKNITSIDEKIISNNEVIFKLLSPMIIREQLDENKSWYHTLDEKGIEIWKKNIIFSLKEKFPINELKKISIENINTKKTVVKFYKTNMVAILGTVKVKGDENILNFLYKRGLSTSRKSFGFGMVDIIE